MGSALVFLYVTCFWDAVERWGGFCCGRFCAAVFAEKENSNGTGTDVRARAHVVIFHDYVVRAVFFQRCGELERLVFAIGVSDGDRLDRKSVV